MKQQKLKLSIIHSNKPAVNALRQYLNTKFGVKLLTSAFYEGKSFLDQLNKETQIVILGSFINEKSYTNISNSIQLINPNVEVILFTSHAEIMIAIEKFRSKNSPGVANTSNTLGKLISFYKSIIDSTKGLTIKFKITKQV